MLCAFAWTICLHVSAGICMFLTFSVISFRARRLWHSANAAAEKQPKSIKNDAKIHQNPSQIHRKSIKMVPRSAPKATLAASLFQVSKKGATAFHKLETFTTTWAILGAILEPAGRQGGPKIKPFGTRMHQKVEK